MACSVSLPTVVRSVSVVNGYLVAVCADGFSRRCKHFSSALKSLLEEFVWADNVVVFEASGSWSVDSWFSNVRVHTPSVVNISDDVVIFDHVNLSAEENAVFIEAVRYGIRRLRLTSENGDDVGVDIRFMPNAEDREDSITKGWCRVTSIANKDYRIMVSYNSNMRKAVDTLFHELRHVAQWNAGVLKSDTGVEIWKDEEFINPDYYTSPWEVDARKAAKIATDDFFGN